MNPKVTKSVRIVKNLRTLLTVLQTNFKKFTSTFQDRLSGTVPLSTYR